MKHFFLILAIFSTLACYSQDTKRPMPKSWEKANAQASFQNRFEAMQKGKTTTETWGTQGVKKRYIDNGTENKNLSVWGGNIIKENDSLYHIFPATWPEDNPKGHMWWTHSDVYHFTSKTLNGPYTLVDSAILSGHNPEIYKTKNNTYVLSVAQHFKPKFYYNKNLNNRNWKPLDISFNSHGKIINDGLTNRSYAMRQDGSFIMVSRGGEIFISKDGLSDYNQVTQSVYPKRPGCFEDPVIWKDSVQYNIIVNDWYGRVAYYLTSGDGITWYENPGIAYSPNIAYHRDGTRESWYKYERIKIFQDKYSRAIQANFAVIDIDKHKDLGNDNHSSKNICLPLNPGLLINVVSQNKKNLKIEIKTEQNIIPAKDIDLETIKFGIANFVDINKGIKPRKIEKKSNGDLILSFNKKELLKNYSNKKNHFAYKFIAKSVKGKMLFGYLSIEEFNKTHSIFISDKPNISFKDKKCFISTTISNYSIKPSKKATYKLYIIKDKKEKLIASKSFPSIKSYDSTKINIITKWDATLAKSYTFKIKIIEGKNTYNNESFIFVPKPNKKIRTSNPKQLIQFPKLIKDSPKPGKIALETLPMYKNTNIHHSIYLPTNYSEKGKKFPLIIELAGNNWKNLCSGKVQDAHLGIALTLGENAIVVSAPYISKSGNENQLTWWGDEEKTANYIKKLVPYICEKYHADSKRVLLCGFSRGAIGVSYIGLHDDEIAKLWCAFFTHDHFDGQKQWNTDWGKPLGVYRNNASIRLKRTNNRPWYISFNSNIESYLQPISIMHANNFADFQYAPIAMKQYFPIIPNKIFGHEHNDNWPAFDFPEAKNARDWVKKILKY